MKFYAQESLFANKKQIWQYTNTEICMIAIMNEMKFCNAEFDEKKNEFLNKGQIVSSLWSMSESLDLASRSAFSTLRVAKSHEWG